MRRRLHLFCFSGTGNAQRVAHWLAAVWREQGVDVTVGNVVVTVPETLAPGPEDELGIVSPTHGFNFPPVTLDFLRRLPRAPARNRAFIVNTRGGLRLFGLCLPGVSGLAQLLAAAVLRWKGYRVVGMRPIDLPSNWISLHPGLGEESVRVLHGRCEAVVRRFGRRLLAGGRDYRALWDLPVDLLVAPLAVGYYLAGRFFIAKSFVATGACGGCQACVRRCPVRAIEWRDGRPFWTCLCESCMRCINECPARAIETAHGFWLLTLASAFLVADWTLNPAMVRLAPAGWTQGAGFSLARFALDGVFTLGVLSAAYRGLHRALRWRPLERLVCATSLTHLRFWRRYRAPRDV